MTASPVLFAVAHFFAGSVPQSLRQARTPTTAAALATVASMAAVREAARNPSVASMVALYQAALKSVAPVRPISERLDVV